MATRIGKESDAVKMLCDLIELDFDAAQAYQAAIDRLVDAEGIAHLQVFREDHLRHTRDLSEIVRDLGSTPPTEGDVKAVLTKGKVVIAGLAGDIAVLRAMKSNEDDTNTAYERAVARDDLTADVIDVLQNNLDDERRHRNWIVRRIDELQRPTGAEMHP